MHQPSASILQALGHGPADRRLAVLREIGAGGSISQAARVVGVSYKAAWQALDTLTNLAGVPLVERVVGGAGGGGARLTEAAHELLAAAGAMHAARAQLAAQLQPGAGPQAAALRLAVQTSMRNQWPCTVQALQASGPLVRVQLRGQLGAAAQLLLWARITRESCELLALREGAAVQALCKATAVRVLPAGQGAPAQSNQWPGRATRVARGELGDEVAAEAAGVQMVGFAPPASRLRPGSRVLLQMDESAVALMLAAP
ncbi:TOBE domain-containing protein [Pulveribacter suum]|nr:TOBE domain-containing protein [Pulveribacter suum]